VVPDGGPCATVLLKRDDCLYAAVGLYIAPMPAGVLRLSYDEDTGTVSIVKSVPILFVFSVRILPVHTFEYAACLFPSLDVADTAV